MNNVGSAACTGITMSKLADIGITADKLAFDGGIIPAGATISPTPDNLAHIERTQRQPWPSTDPRGLIADEDYARLRGL